MWLKWASPISCFFRGVTARSHLAHRQNHSTQVLGWHFADDQTAPAQFLPLRSFTRKAPCLFNNTMAHQKCRSWMLDANSWAMYPGGVSEWYRQSDYESPVDGWEEAEEEYIPLEQDEEEYISVPPPKRQKR